MDMNKFEICQKMLQSTMTLFVLSLVLILLVCLSYVSHGEFMPPTKGITYYCYTMQCVSDSAAALKPYDAVVIGLLSYDFSQDSYLALYLGALLELFDMPEYFFVAIVLQTPAELEPTDAAYQFVQYLPEKSIFVSIEHGRSGTGIQTLRHLQQHGVAPRVIFHMNHEQPWEVSQGDFLNHIFDSVEELSDFYSKFDLVLRNYYYTPLLSNSYYVPVSPPFEGSVVSNASSAVFTSAQQRLASQRSLRCHFKGRVDYAKYSKESEFSSAVPVLMQSDAAFPQAVERRQLLELAAQGRLASCVAEESEASTPNSYLPDAGQRFMASYAAYTETLADTAFVLCPAGNNPETFRHIEAMEFGAIPVMLRPRLPAQDFLQDPHWRGFPGPVLAGWEDLEAFLEGITPSEMDALQSRVKEWYANFKLQKKAGILQQLHTTFTHISQGTQKPEKLLVGDQVEEVQVLKDLKFREIPEGAYQSATQRLLAQVLRLEAKVRHLETIITQLPGVVSDGE